MISFQSQRPNSDNPEVADVDAEEVYEKKDQVQIVDVRRSDEYSGELGHIPGAELITLDTLPHMIDELPADAPLVFVCRSGGRSAKATAFAKENGFEHAYNLQGGMLRWNELGYGVE